MSGTTIPYGDRPIIRDDGFATFEFHQFLERLTKAANQSTTGGSNLQPQITANTNDINTLEGQIATLNSQVATATTAAGQAQLQVAAIANRVPSETVLAPADAIVLTTGVTTELLQFPVSAGVRVVMGMVCLTGAGSVTIVRASAGLNVTTLETDPGSFATGWFGAGASPGTLGVDLTVGTFVRVLNVVHVAAVPTTLYLNVNATLTGAISAYGSLIVWPLGA